MDWLRSPSQHPQEERWILRPSVPFLRRIGEERMQVFVPSHPVIRHFLGVLRNELSPTDVFRRSLAELGRYLIYEAARDWSLTVEAEVKTASGITKGDFMNPGDTVRVIPILRGGLVLVENVLSVLPFTQTYHLGFIQKENSIEPSLYVNKLPERFPNGAKFLIADPMLSTGGYLISTIDLLKKRNVDHRLIRVIAAVAAPSALEVLSDKYPGLRVYTGNIDEGVGENGYVIPGIGDAGDRCFGT